MKRNKIKIKNIGKNYNSLDLEEYLLKNLPTKNSKKNFQQKAKTQFHQKNKSLHDSAIKKIYENPGLIGINDEFYSARKEIDFFEFRVKRGAVDLFIETPNQKYIIEYKCNNSTDCENKAKTQLRKAKRLLRDEANTKIGLENTTLLYVYGNFSAEKLTSKGLVPFNYTHR